MPWSVLRLCLQCLSIILLSIPAELDTETIDVVVDFCSRLSSGLCLTCLGVYFGLVPCFFRTQAFLTERERAITSQKGGGNYSAQRGNNSAKRRGQLQRKKEAITAHIKNTILAQPVPRPEKWESFFEVFGS